jgi:hypothetical protein
VKIKLLTVFLAAFGISFVATMSKNELTVCSGGLYCEDARQECLASGTSQTICNRVWQSCVIDACPQ